MLVKFEQNRMVQTTRNFEPFEKNKTKQNKAVLEPRVSPEKVSDP